MVEAIWGHGERLLRLFVHVRPGHIKSVNPDFRQCLKSTSPDEAGQEITAGLITEQRHDRRLALCAVSCEHGLGTNISKMVSQMRHELSPAGRQYSHPVVMGHAMQLGRSGDGLQRR